jgi:site-specific recombinase XerD
MRPEPRLEPQPGIPEPATRRSSPAQPTQKSQSPQRRPEIGRSRRRRFRPPDTTDAELVALWLHGKSPHTVRAYGDDVAAFRRFTGKPLRATYLSDLQRCADSLVGAPATRGRLKTLKSLLSFATRMGYLPFNAGAAIRGPALEQKLAERILSERQVFALLEAVEDRPRDHALIPPPFGGLRVSELVALRWRNLAEGVANVTGKGGKTRVVRLSRGTWAELQALRTDKTIGEDWVFPMSAVNAWSGSSAPPSWPGSARSQSPRTSCATPMAPTFCAAGRTTRLCRDTLGHASIATTSRYLHARPEKSSGDYLAI